MFSSAKLGGQLPYVGFIVPDLSHDLGIAFLVSFAVAWLFEIYRSERQQMESMRDVIDFVMGEEITANVWMEVKELIEHKSVIRRDVRFRFEFDRIDGLNSHEWIMKVEHEYRLYSLRSKRIKLNIHHELDYQFECKPLGLPKWETGVVDPSTAKTRPQEPIKLATSELDIEVSLPKRADNDSVFVRTERSEIVHVPGSYNFHTPEFVKGLRLSIIKCPPGVRLEVWVRPHGRGEVLREEDHTWFCDQIIFPDRESRSSSFL